MPAGDVPYDVVIVFFNASNSSFTFPRTQHVATCVSQLDHSIRASFIFLLNITSIATMSWMDSWSRPRKSQPVPPPLYLTPGGEATPYCRSCGRVISEFFSSSSHCCSVCFDRLSSRNGAHYRKQLFQCLAYMVIHIKRIPFTRHVSQ